MPRVPRYERQILTNPLPGARFGARFTPLSFGANLGEEVSKIGFEIYQEERRKADQIGVMDADRRLGDLENKLLYGQGR